MAQEYYRFRLDLAVPKSIWEGLNQAQRNAWKDRVQAVKALARKINEGLGMAEENTIRAGWHLCKHELGLPCALDEDI